METDNTNAMLKIMDLPKKKSMPLALALAFFFGWIGVFYCNWKAALWIALGTLVGLIIYAENYDLSSGILFLSGIVSIVVAYESVKRRNTEIDDKRRKLEAIVGMQNG